MTTPDLPRLVKCAYQHNVAHPISDECIDAVDAAPDATDLDRLIAEQMQDPAFARAFLDGQERERQATYERGVAEGRRQATEGWDREWGVRWMQDAVDPTEDIYPCSGESVALARQERSGGYRRAESRLVGPWEPAGQSAPTEGANRGDR